MSFMFNPFPYDDPSAVNRIEVDRSITDSITRDTQTSAAKIVQKIREQLKKKKSVVLGLDGYISAPLEQLAAAVSMICDDRSIPVTLMETADLYLDEDQLDENLKPYLPEDRDVDPVLLFGSLYHEGYEGLLNPAAVTAFKEKIQTFSDAGEGLLIVYGQAALIDAFRPLFDLKLYVDMTQKTTILNYRNGRTKNLGSKRFMRIKEMLRRAYYIDFEVAAALRGQLIKNGEIDFYLTGDHDDDIKMISLDDLKTLFEVMVTYPLRCRPVYNEGVWGGQYVKRLRRLPDNMKNCAWSFDLIPMEVSIVAEANGLQLEFPFYCFVQTMGDALMGPEVVKRFGGYFPIRFNYDDTFHSSGNMSIQVHPPEAYIRGHYNELERQDESYYVVVAGHGAQTYLGFREDADVEAFIENSRRADKEGVPFDYEQYVQPNPSAPGRQFLIPAGSIHSSGRNQVVLEIGSLTIGSYTYKMYDYMRKDLDGKLRPIHTYHGDKVLERDRRKEWVRENLIQEPRLVREGPGWKEIIVGEHPLIYFSLRNLIFDQRVEDETTDRFHVLALVDGDKVIVRSLTDPNRYFKQNYLDIIVVPASFGPYEIINKGDGPVVMHKTLLKDGYEQE